MQVSWRSKGGDESGTLAGSDIAAREGAARRSLLSASGIKEQRPMKDAGP